MRVPAQYSGLIYLLLIVIKTKTRLKLAEMKLRVLLQQLNCFELQPKDATRLKAHTKLRVLVQHLTDYELQTKDQCRNDY